MEKNIRLVNWEVVQYNSICCVLVGKVYGHPRFKDGEEITTSKLKNIDFEKGVAHTLNTTYHLVLPKSLQL